MNLTKANEARMNAALDKLYRFPEGVESFRQRIARGVYSRAESADVPRVEYNRIKFNRMSGAQQAEYERKLKETKREYRLFYVDDPDAYTPVPKMVHDHFLSMRATN